MTDYSHISASTIGGTCDCQLRREARQKGREDSNLRPTLQSAIDLLLIMVATAFSAVFLSMMVVAYLGGSNWTVLVGFNWFDEAIPELVVLVCLLFVGSLDLIIHFRREYRKRRSTVYDIAEAW